MARSVQMPAARGRIHLALRAGVLAGLLGMSSAQAQSLVSLSGVRLTPTQNSAAGAMTDARIEDERLSLRFPCSSDQFIVKRPTLEKDAPADRVVMLACEREDAAHFAAIALDFANLSTAKARFEESANTIAGTAIRDAFSFSGKEARDYIMHNDRSCGWTRLILDGRRMLILTGERMDGACGSIESESRSFFDSLDFTKQ